MTRGNSLPLEGVARTAASWLKGAAKASWGVVGSIFNVFSIAGLRLDFGQPKNLSLFTLPLLITLPSSVSNRWLTACHANHFAAEQQIYSSPFLYQSQPAVIGLATSQQSLLCTQEHLCLCRKRGPTCCLRHTATVNRRGLVLMVYIFQVAEPVFVCISSLVLSMLTWVLP